MQIEQFAFNEQGLIPAVLQDQETGQVLMVAYMNPEAIRLTLNTGEAHFWSRSRGELWRKGATSGNTMQVSAIQTDCDRDTLLLQVQPAGPACHTGSRSCFFRTVPYAPSQTNEVDEDVK
jgi:phosphoribosyl-ATP pyrophosphohydrolase/phosphoribosyl-AMP cyclohydrolase